MLPCHHEDSNPVLLVTKEVFYLSNSGGERYGVNHQLKKERTALPLSYRPTCLDRPGLEPGTCR